ncbi:hypothetical protein DICPUDRAFT_148822 [Dictyostelium purpureum]|uniref:DUF218 domain-containing protein n=1 Tax=Dictyostelium purpureum TaxID=5786 RepID=F0ZC38_DICPU|nr:uncharacterized protein DICPUDRAFT_148822 [Dictyostelium purpureum]EGC38521.1 hypothetical protein DICPUDRAFT_148822 [Dictyostelium purpureum]|eukprot:XP_003284986.1 hypothetical protein DICPUDRAFT_148822 [Dictyostelium purpureum]
MFYNQRPTKFQNIIGTLSKNKVRVLVILVLVVYLFSFLSFKSSAINSLNSNEKLKTKTFEKNGSENKINYNQQQQQEENKIQINDENKNNKNIIVTQSEEGKEINKILEEQQEQQIQQRLDSQQPVEYDTAIIVLGYSLHPDGMPTQILKERVVLAAQYYAQLQGEGSNIKLILSGKSKATSFEEDQGFNSEAEAMNEIALHNDVPARDIMIENNSTNTAENAKYTLEFLKQHNIQRLFIVTSDFHVLRSQYIFQTVFPSTYDLIFVGSQTSMKTQTMMKDKEKVLFQSSKRDLDGLGLLGDKNIKGYHPYRNLPRWRMIERELNLDKRELESTSLIADYGSNEGYFSIQMAKKFPQARVYSFEGEAINEYNAATVKHESQMKEQNIENNFLCKTKIHPTMFKMLVEKQQLYEYQLCLSIFHWFDMNTRDDFEETLINHLVSARTTFIELPEAMNYKGNEGQHAHGRINRWYADRTEDQILRDIKEKFEIPNMTWKTLGAILHENKTVRKLIRVDIRLSPEDRSPLDHETLKTEVYNCGKLIKERKNSF